MSAPPLAGPGRVLMTTDAVGGVARYTATLAAGWRALGVTPVIAVLGPTPAATMRAALAAASGRPPVETGLPLDWTAPDPDALAAASRDLAALARAERVDSVHLHAPGLLGDAAWPTPVIVAVHSCLRTWWAAMRPGETLPAALAWRDRAAASGVARADAVVAPSRSFARAVEAAYRPGRAILAIPNGLPPAPAPVAGPRGASVLACGRLWDEAKDIATLERAAALRPELAFAAAGALRGPNGERAPMLARVRALGTLDDAALRGARAEHAVFVATARYEPFGLAVAEAAQGGMALVLADIPSARELWDGAAMFFPPGDARALAEVIGQARAETASLGAAARARSARYGAAAMAQATLAAHASVARAVA